MTDKKIETLEKTCIWQEFGNDKSSLDNSPCLGCSDCYLPKNMVPEKKEFYKGTCKEINYSLT